MTGAASRRRGANAERMVVDHLRGHGFPDARRYLAGDGRQRHLGDVDAIPGVAVEVKDRSASAWTGWCREVEDGNPRVTCVVRRVRGNPDVGQWPAVVGSLDDWLSRLDGVRPMVRIVSTSCRAEKWLEMYGRVEWDDGDRVRVVTTFADFVHAARAEA